MKILIVEDSRATQTIVRRIIEQLNYSSLQMDFANNGKEGLDKIRTWEPDLIISDWHMPEMNGIELLTALNREMLGIPMGFITTEIDQDKKTQALDLGAQFFIEKPFDTKQLHDAVIPLIEKHSLGVSNDTKVVQTNSQPSVSLENAPERLQAILRKTSKLNINIKTTKPLTFKKSHLPCVLSLFESPEDKKIKALVIVDINASCLITAAMTNMDNDAIKKKMLLNTIDKTTAGHCENFVKSINHSLLTQNNSQPLSLRSSKVIHQNIAIIESLLAKAWKDRINLSIDIDNVGKGNITLISA